MSEGRPTLTREDRISADAVKKMAASNAGQSFILPAAQPTATEARKDTQEEKPQEPNLEGPQSVPIGFTQSPTKAPEVADEPIDANEMKRPFARHYRRF